MGQEVHRGKIADGGESLRSYRRGLGRQSGGGAVVPRLQIVFDVTRPGVDPKKILLFRTVAQCGSMSSAARSLHLTQSAVSQQLRLLEREAGSPLLVRSTRGIDLTEAGALLLDRADAISSELHMATEE